MIITSLCIPRFILNISLKRLMTCLRFNRFPHARWTKLTLLKQSLNYHIFYYHIRIRGASRIPTLQWGANLGFCQIFLKKTAWKWENFRSANAYQWRIQDFPQGGAPTPKITIILQIFAKNCMKMKEFGPPGGARPWRPPWIRQCVCKISRSFSKFVHIFFIKTIFTWNKR